MTDASTRPDLVSRLADRSNPLLVRLLRQEMRSRGFVATYALALVLACAMAVGICLVESVNVEARRGQALFLVCAGAWIVASWLIAGQTAFAALARERTDDTWDLVELTGMGPRRVILGVFANAAVQAAVYGAALSPFMMLGYLMRGVDIGLVLLALIGVPLGALFCAGFALLMGSAGVTKAARAGLGFLSFVGLLIACGMGILALVNSQEVLRDMFWSWETAATVLTIMLSVWAWWLLLFLVLATSRLHHRAADRSTWPRLVVLAMPLYAVALALGFWFAFASPHAFPGALWFMLGTLAVFIQAWAVIVGLCSISEPWAVSPRQARSIQAAPLWRRWLTPLLGPGAARGRWAYLALVVFALLLTVPQWFAEVMDQYRFALIPAKIAFAIACYGMVLNLLGDSLCRGLFPRVLGNPDWRRLSMLAFLALYLALTTIISASLGAFHFHQDAAGFFWAPIAALYHIGDIVRRDDVAGVMSPLILIGIAGLIAFAILIVQALRMRVRTIAVRAEDGDRNPRG